ncbi:hypothetical protein [Streptomyces sp. NRRL F-2664]|uniref:hypothetical protein n=1 Tax=Streptomyces sp. NRRL F-2664 TaxID=1463842 RepID=UPI0005BDFE20|nr:hypothetical protein [Streptomyces sp. NRRL F-2664]
MNTFLSFLAVLALAALLLAPSLYGFRHERRIDRQLRAVENRLVWLPRQKAGGMPPTPQHGHGPRTAGWRRGRLAH